jgi:hypothetical protein
VTPGADESAAAEYAIAMRLNILLWSALTGALLGVFLGSLSLGGLILAATVLPPLQRAGDRLRPAVLIILLVIVPIVGGVLGYLEGRAKLS